jgi:hypothetical protein
MVPLRPFAVPARTFTIITVKLPEHLRAYSVSQPHERPLNRLGILRAGCAADGCVQG